MQRWKYKKPTQNHQRCFSCFKWGVDGRPTIHFEEMFDFKKTNNKEVSRETMFAYGRYKLQLKGQTPLCIYPELYWNAIGT